MVNCPVCHNKTLEMIDCKEEEVSRTLFEKWVRYHTHWKCNKCGVKCVDHSHPKPVRI